MNCKPFIGSIYGRLLVTQIDGKLATCQCACGQSNHFVCRVANLSNGTTKSCGCLRREVGKRSMTHGMTGASEYKTWQQMRERCLDPKDKSYVDYGARGITVCDRWRISFEAFYEDMGPRPSPKHTLDRKDNDGPYSPENCRWATKTEQTRNRRNAINITYAGETKPLAVWCEEFGINYYTAHRKLRREGKSPDVVFSKRIHLLRDPGEDAVDQTLIWKSAPSSSKEHA